MRGGTVKKRAALLVWLPIVLAFVFSAPAQAGTVDATQGVVFTATPGETNTLTITRGLDSVIVADLGAPLSVLGDCISIDPNTASCPTGGSLVALLGDGDDEADVNVPHSLVVGGEGADTVTAWGRVRGGSGNDTLATHPSGGTLNGGEGNDALRGGEESSSTWMIGGPGSDTFIPGRWSYVSYEGRTNPVVVDADGNPDDGETGEGDNVLPGVDTIIGGRGDDRLSMIGGVHQIWGGAGDDVLDARFAGRFSQARGGPGDDTLFGGTIHDDLVGGYGHDILVGRGGSDWMEGGPGDDVLKGGRGRDALYGDHPYEDLGRGDDLLVGGRGGDSADGGRGADTLLMRDAPPARDRINGGPGRDRARIDRGLDRIFDVEILF
jgi:Ca2+-binding RTX toxin-like protein